MGDKGGRDVCPKCKQDSLMETDQQREQFGQLKRVWRCWNTHVCNYEELR